MIGEKTIVLDGMAKRSGIFVCVRIRNNLVGGRIEWQCREGQSEVST